MAKDFKEWIADQPHLFVFYPTDDSVAAEHAHYLVEGGRVYDLGQNWSFRFDRGHVPKMRDHVHVKLKGNDVSIINRDGSPSHGTRRDAVPHWVLDRIKDRGLIESTLLQEAASLALSVPSEVIEHAYRHAGTRDMLNP